MGEGGNISFQNHVPQSSVNLCFWRFLLSHLHRYGHLGLFIPPEITQWISIMVACKHFRLFVYAWTPLGSKESLTLSDALLWLTSGTWMLHVLPVSFGIILVANVLDVHLYISFHGNIKLILISAEELGIIWPKHLWRAGHIKDTQQSSSTVVLLIHCFPARESLL